MRKVTALLVLAMIGVWVTSAHAGSPVDFYLAGTKPIEGFQKATIEGSALYVAPRPALLGDNIKSSNAMDTRSGTDIEVMVGPDMARKLAAAMTEQKADRLVAMVGGQILGAGTARVEEKDGRITIIGLKPTMARRLARVLNGGSITQLGPGIILVPSTKSVAPGQMITVEVFAANVPDLRVFQVALDIAGGKSGQLSVSDLRIDASRSDFVFADQKKIDAVDKSGGRLGAMLIEGSVGVPTPAYLGTFTLSASNDAAGSFTVSVRVADNSSFMKDGSNQGIDFFTDRAMTITVGEPERTRGDGK